MSNYIETTKELAAYLSAITPLIVIHTEERGRAQGALTEAARELNIDIDFYTECDQFVELRKGERAQDVGGEPLSFIEETLKKKTHCVEPCCGGGGGAFLFGMGWRKWMRCRSFLRS